MEELAERLYEKWGADAGVAQYLRPWQEIESVRRKRFRREARDRIRAVLSLPAIYEQRDREWRERLPEAIETAVRVYSENERGVGEALDAGCELSELPTSLEVATKAAIAAAFPEEAE